MGTWIKLAALLVVVALAASVFVAWRDARKQQTALQAELKTTQQALAEVTARQASRDAAVNDLAAALKKKESTVQKPAQVVAALPDLIIALPTTTHPIPSGIPPTQNGTGWRTPRASQYKPQESPWNPTKKAPQSERFLLTKSPISYIMLTRRYARPV